MFEKCTLILITAFAPANSILLYYNITQRHSNYSTHEKQRSLNPFIIMHGSWLMTYCWNVAYYKPRSGNLVSWIFLILNESKYKKKLFNFSASKPVQDLDYPRR